MTIKDYNKIRSAVYEAAMEIPDVQEAIRVAGIARIIEVHQPPDKHGMLVLTSSTQLNDNTLRQHGFDPDGVDVRTRFVLHQQTKCADIL